MFKGCNEFEKTKPISIKRCNEMIDEFDEEISILYSKPHKYSMEERQSLIKEIQKYPKHFWVVGENGVEHSSNPFISLRYSNEDRLIFILKNKYPNIKTEYDYSNSMVKCSVFMRASNYQNLCDVIAKEFGVTEIQGTNSRKNPLSLIEFKIKPLYIEKLDLIKNLIE